MICTILTIAVYTYVKKLRNTLGKCVISCLFSMVMLYLLEILLWLRPWLIHSFLGMRRTSDQIFNILLCFFNCRNNTGVLLYRLHVLAFRY